MWRGLVYRSGHDYYYHMTLSAYPWRVHAATSFEYDADIHICALTDQERESLAMQRALFPCEGNSVFSFRPPCFDGFVDGEGNAGDIVEIFSCEKICGLHRLSFKRVSR